MHLRLRYSLPEEGFLRETPITSSEQSTVYAVQQRCLWGVEGQRVLCPCSGQVVAHASRRCSQWGSTNQRHPLQLLFWRALLQTICRPRWFCLIDPQAESCEPFSWEVRTWLSARKLYLSRWHRGAQRARVTCCMAVLACACDVDALFLHYTTGSSAGWQQVQNGASRTLWIAEKRGRQKKKEEKLRLTYSESKKSYSLLFSHTEILIPTFSKYVY